MLKIFAVLLFLACNNEGKMKPIFEWDEEKRQKNIKERGLDIFEIASIMFDSSDTIIWSDNRKDYGEKRFRAFAIVKEECICLCFTRRNKKMHLITIFRMRKKEWEKCCERKNN